MKIDDKNYNLAAKRLGNTKIVIPPPLNGVDVVWCRTTCKGTEKWNKKKHRHSFFELHYCLNGVCNLAGEDIDHYNLAKNELLLIKPGVNHAFISNSEDYVEFVVGFQIQAEKENHEVVRMEERLKNCASMATAKGSEIMETYILSMLDNVVQTDSIPVMENALLVQLIFLESVKRISPHGNDMEIEPETDSPDVRMEKIKLFVKDNLNQNITGSDIAMHLHLSVKQVNRIIWKETGLTCRNYIVKRKIKRIKRLLVETDDSLSRISEIIGISNEFNMSRLFKKEEGMSPGAFRLSCRK